MFSKPNGQIEPSSCRWAQGKPIYLPPTFHGHRNGRFVDSHKNSANIWPYLRKSFQTILNPGGLFKVAGVESRATNRK